MKTLLYNSLILLALLFVSYTAKAQKDLLFLGYANSGPDSAMIDYLDAEGGYTVTFVSRDDYKANVDYATAAAYDDYDAFFVSESIGSSDAANFKTAGFPIPVVATEGFLLKPGKWDILSEDNESVFVQASGDNKTEDNLTLVITNNEHWITQDYDLDEELVWAESETPTTLGVTSFYIPDTTVDKATSIAKFKQDMGDLSTVWVIDSGATMHGTTTLPNMVFIGIIQTDLAQTFTTDFYNFVIRCLQWVTGDYEIPVEPSGINTLKTGNTTIYPIPSEGLVNIKITLNTVSEVKINIYDVTGKLMLSEKYEMLNKGENNISLDISNLNTAQYIYEIITDTEIIKGKLIKE